jgi:hypothetical protein
MNKLALRCIKLCLTYLFHLDLLEESNGDSYWQFIIEKLLQIIIVWIV